MRWQAALPACRRHYPGRTGRACSLVLPSQLRPSPTHWRASSCIKLFRGLLSVHSRYSLETRGVANATLSIGGFSGFVTPTAAPIATGWNEPVPGRDFHPLKTSAFHGAQPAPFYPGANRDPSPARRIRTASPLGEAEDSGWRASREARRRIHRELRVPFPRPLALRPQAFGRRGASPPCGVGYQGPGVRF